MKFNLGDKVKDVVSGFTGVVVGHTKWLTGCDTYTVNPQEIKDGKPVSSSNFDENSLILIEASAVKLPEEKPPLQAVKTGGPRPDSADRPER